MIHARLLNVILENVPGTHKRRYIYSVPSFNEFKMSYNVFVRHHVIVWCHLKFMNATRRGGGGGVDGLPPAARV